MAQRVPHDIIVAYRDLDRFGYAESDRNWMKEYLRARDYLKKMIDEGGKK